MPSSTFQRITFDTSSFEPRLRAYALSKWVKPLAEAHPNDGASLSASFVTYKLGSMMLTRSASGPARYIRKRQSIADSALKDFILLRLIVKGKARSSFTRNDLINLGEGDIYLNDLAEPAELWTSEIEHLDLLLRRETTEEMSPWHGRVLRKGWLPCRMLTQHLVNLETALTQHDTRHARDVLKRTIGVVHACVGENKHFRDRRERNTVLQKRIQEHIDDQLDDCELSIADIQRKFRVSRTFLYNLFAEIGGIQQYIRGRRLDAAFRDLRDQPSRSIYDIALSRGFTNERQFQRAVRARYGMSARDLRDRYGDES